MRGKAFWLGILLLVAGCLLYIHDTNILEELRTEHGPLETVQPGPTRWAYATAIVMRGFSIFLVLLGLGVVAYGIWLLKITTTVFAIAIIAIVAVAVAGVYIAMRVEALPETIPFFEDFEDGTRNWNLDEGWRLETINGNTVLKGEGHRWARLKRWLNGNYIFETRFKIIRGNVHFNYRHITGIDGLRRYFIGVNMGYLRLTRQIGDEFYELAKVPMGLDVDWHKIEIRGYGNLINVYVDNELYIVHKDEKMPILEGRIAFETLENSEVLIDDVEIRRASLEDLVAEPT
jgi:hypothetical protein